MLTIEIQGEKIPTLGFGTWPLRGETCRRATLSALQLGYRHLDTAEMYRNESEVGEAIRQSKIPRHEIYLVTKVWSSNLHGPDLRRSAEGSLRRLGVETVDLLLIHWPNPRVPIEESMAEMVRLQEEGKTRQIGVSNFSPSQLAAAQEAAQVPLFCNQVEFNPLRPQRELLRICQEQDLLLTAYGPVAKGAVSREPLLREIGRRHGKTAAQVSLRWLLQQPNVSAIPKAASRKHQEENLAIFDFELSEAEMAEIDSLST